MIKKKFFGFERSINYLLVFISCVVFFSVLFCLLFVPVSLYVVIIILLYCFCYKALLYILWFRRNFNIKFPHIPPSSLRHNYTHQQKHIFTHTCEHFYVSWIFNAFTHPVFSFLFFFGLFDTTNCLIISFNFTTI